MKTTKLLAALTTLLLATTATAGDDHKKALFSSLDIDKNGAISAEEANADKALATVFKKLDKDQDGAISKAEFAEFRNKVQLKKVS